MTALRALVFGGLLLYTALSVLLFSLVACVFAAMKEGGGTVVG